MWVDRVECIYDMKTFGVFFKCWSFNKAFSAHPAGPHGCVKTSCAVKEPRFVPQQRHPPARTLWMVFKGDKAGGDAWNSGTGEGRRGLILTLLFSPVQWTIAWLWVASPLSTKELLSRDICFSRESALLNRGELPTPTASSSESVGKPGGGPPSPPPMSNVPSSVPRRFKAPLVQRTGPGSVIQVVAVNRKTQRCAAAESGLSGRRDAMLRAVVALVSRRLMERRLMLVEDR